MAAILLVCTGNICRSPIAEGLIRRALQVRLGQAAPTVASAGTAGLAGALADPHAVEAAAERGADISTHRGRRLRESDLAQAALVVAMALEHRDRAIRMAPHVAGKAFTLKELVRLLEALPPPADGSIERVLAARVRAADELRRSGFQGNPNDEDVADPLGLPLEAFRAMTWELEDWCARLADGLFGKTPARASRAGDEG